MLIEKYLKLLQQFSFKEYYLVVLQPYLKEFGPNAIMYNFGIVLAIIIVFYLVFKKLLFLFNPSYRQSIFRDQVVYEMEREEASERELEIRDRINDKESRYLSK